MDDSQVSSSNLFEWPEVLAAAMHSVMCDMNRNPQPVRVYAASDAELIVDRQLFSEAVSQYYNNILPGLSVQDLKRISSRKVGFNGTPPGIGDGTVIIVTPNTLKLKCITQSFTLFIATKAELRRYLKSKDLEFVTLLSRRLLPSSEWLLTEKMGRSLLGSPEDAQQVITNIGGQLPVTKAQFRTFLNNERVSSQCMDIVCKLFQLQDDRIAEVYHDVNHRRTNYQPFKKNCIFGEQFLFELIIYFKARAHTTPDSTTLSSRLEA